MSVSRGTRHRTLRCRLRGEPLEPRLLLTSVGASGIEVAGTAWAADAAGETRTTALNVGPLDGTRTYSGWVGWFDRRDTFRFELSDESSIDLQLSELQRDVDLYLFDGQGQLVDRSINSDRASERIADTLSAGTYYVSVSPWAWWSSSSYQLQLSAERVVPAPNPVPQPDTAPPTTVPFPDVPDFGGTRAWNLNAMNAPESWAQGYEGAGVTVAVVDTGVDLRHPELSSAIWVNASEIPGNGLDDDSNGFVDDVHGWDFVHGDNLPSDGNGHGTHVAGIIAAANNGYGATGVAPHATIMPVQVLGTNGSGTMQGVAEGIRYAADNGADVINLSLGGGLSSTLQSAIEYARRLGVLVVAAAGNAAATLPSFPAQLSSLLDNVISVGATTAAGDHAEFSNRVGVSGAVQVDAPGVEIYSAYAGSRYASLSGTSMATPHVAGLAALALSAQPNVTPQQLRTLIVQGADAAVSGSDSRGAINAALTVALAAAFDGVTPIASAATSEGPVGSSPTGPFATSRRLDGRGQGLFPGWSAGAETARRAARHTWPTSGIGHSPLTPPDRDRVFQRMGGEPAPAGRILGTATLIPVAESERTLVHDKIMTPPAPRALDPLDAVLSDALERSVDDLVAIRHVAPA